MVTKVTLTRRRIISVVASGNATTGKIYDQFGFEGLKNIARHIRLGNHKIEGFYIPEGKNDAAVDRKWAEKLQAMPPGTKIVQIIEPRKGA